MGTKLNYQQRYLDEELKNHVKQLLEELASVPSDDENDEDDDDDKENLGVKIDEEYETDEDENDGNKMDIV